MLGIPVAFGVSFALMAFTTFVYDTLDVCTRLGRYILQELTGRHDRLGRWGATAATAAVPLYFLLQPPRSTALGKAMPAWKIFWNLFGASNQLLAALTLIGVTVWLWQTRRAWWVWLVTGLPAALMYVMSTWALVSMIRKHFKDGIDVRSRSLGGRGADRTGRADADRGRLGHHLPGPGLPAAEIVAASK